MHDVMSEELESQLLDMHAFCLEKCECVRVQCSKYFVLRERNLKVHAAA